LSETGKTPANPEGVPWGDNNPTRAQRIVVALLIAALAGGGLAFHLKYADLYRTDFSQLKFGAEAMLRGADPYKLVGMGQVFESKWPVMYPGTAYVAAIPFVPLSDIAAGALFIAIGAFLLAYGSTAGTWHRLPMFASYAFMHNVQLAQWSPLVSAMLFLPWLAVFAAAKPNQALPILLSAPSSRLWRAAVAGGFTLFAISVALFPQWPFEWLRIVMGGVQMQPPIIHLGGFCILLVLIKWRRPEAWLVLLMACMPASWAWYNVLILLAAVPKTYREAAMLSLVSSFGALLGINTLPGPASATSFPHWWAFQVAFGYLPAVILILTRPNVREAPPWSEPKKSLPASISANSSVSEVDALNLPA
jgi:hypothetical protein